MYPFSPKSTAKLERGQFWPIPLSNDQFGAGCVIGKRVDSGKENTRVFIAAVLKWVGASAPTAADLVGAGVYELGFAHIKCISELGVSIEGKALVGLSSEPQSAGSGALETWGYAVPTKLAEKYVALAANNSLQARRP